MIFNIQAINDNDQNHFYCVVAMELKVIGVAAIYRPQLSMFEDRKYMRGN